MEAESITLEPIAIQEKNKQANLVVTSLFSKEFDKASEREESAVCQDGKIAETEEREQEETATLLYMLWNPNLPFTEDTEVEADLLDGAGLNLVPSKSSTQSAESDLEGLTLIDELLLKGDITNGEKNILSLTEEPPQIISAADFSREAVNISYVQAEQNEVKTKFETAIHQNNSKGDLNAVLNLEDSSILRDSFIASLVEENIISEDQQFVPKQAITTGVFSENNEENSFRQWLLSDAETIEVSSDEALTKDIVIDHLSEDASSEVGVDHQEEVKRMMDELEVTDTEYDGTEESNHFLEERLNNYVNANITRVQTNTKETIEVSQKNWANEVNELIFEQMEGIEAVDQPKIIHLQLTPQSLGGMDIELVMNNNKLSAKFFVEHERTKEWLDQELSQLVKNLAVQDVQVDDIQVVIPKQTHELINSETQNNSSFRQKNQNSHQNKEKIMSSEQMIDEETEKVSKNTGHLNIWA